MNKKWIILIIGLFVIIGLVLVILKPAKVNDETSLKTENNTKQENSPKKLKTACDIYTEEIAKKYLGSNAVIGDTANSTRVDEGNDTITSQCLYQNDGDVLKIINIQLIAAKNDAGVEWVVKEFQNSPFETATITEGEPPTLETFTGIGSKAYWNPSTGQLCVLIDDGKYWLSIQGSINSSEQDKSELKSMAMELIDNI